MKHQKMKIYQRFREEGGHACLLEHGDEVCAHSVTRPVCPEDKIDRVTCLNMRRVTCLLCLVNPAFLQAEDAP